MCDTSGLSHGPYLGTTTFCSLASLLILLMKACVYTPAQDIGPELSPSLADHKLNMKMLWGMPALFLSSLIFALGHFVVAYRTSCRARRKLLIHRIDPESVWPVRLNLTAHDGLLFLFGIYGPFCSFSDSGLQECLSWMLQGSSVAHSAQCETLFKERERDKEKNSCAR